MRKGGGRGIGEIEWVSKRVVGLEGGREREGEKNTYTFYMADIVIFLLLDFLTALANAHVIFHAKKALLNWI